MTSEERADKLRKEEQDSAPANPNFPGGGGIGRSFAVIGGAVGQVGPAPAAAANPDRPVAAPVAPAADPAPPRERD